MPLGSKLGTLGRIYAERMLNMGYRAGMSATAMRGQVAARFLGSMRNIPGRSAGRILYRSGRRAYRGFNRMPGVAKVGAAVGLIGIGSGVQATRGFLSGWGTSFMNRTDMYNRAHGYGQLGEEQYRRNQGRMPENHLGAAGIGLALSRSRHG